MNPPDPPEDPPLSLLGLPPELRDNIIDHLPINAVLNLRGNRKAKLEPRCLERLQKECTRLYLHPTRLQHVLEVCEHGKFANEITEIVLLGKSSPSMTNSEHYEHPQLYYRPWPQFLKCAVDGHQPTHKELDQAARDNDSIPVLYEPLFYALARLKKVHKVSYACGPIGPGFCQVSEQDVAAHTEARGKDGDYESFFGGPDHLDTSLATKTYWWSDTEMAICLMKAGIWQLTDIAFHQPLPLCDFICWGRLGAGVGTTSDNEFDLRTVNTLTLTVPGNNDWTKTCISLLDSVPSLNSLNIVVASFIDAYWEDQIKEYEASPGDDTEFQSYDVWEEELSDVGIPLPFHEEDKLKLITHFAISGTAGIPDALEADPVINFLQKHRGTLRTVEIDNVFFSDFEHQTDIHDAMKAVLQCMASIPGIETAKFSVPRLGCDGLCGFTDGEHWKLYGRYPSLDQIDFYWETAEVFDRLADELSVNLKDGHWDFGEWVMAHRL